MHNFTVILRDKLKDENISRLARRLDIPPTLLFEWKEAKRLPSFKNLIHVKKLTEYLNVEFEDIVLNLKPVAFEK